jgi:hypothetical protein
MPWQLTTVIDTGDLDTTSYGEVKIVRQIHDSIRGMVSIDLEYGNTVQGAWVPGLSLHSKPSSVFIDGTDYLALITDSEPEQDEKTYDAVKRGLYEFLASKNYIGPGHIS